MLYRAPPVTSAPRPRREPRSLCAPAFVRSRCTLVAIAATSLVRTAPSFAQVVNGDVKAGPPPAPTPASAPAPAPAPAPASESEPFTFADFTWLNGSSPTTESPLGNAVFTAELRVDTQYAYSLNHPADDTIGGSSVNFRSGEFQLTQLGLGGDAHYLSMRARVMTQFGMYSETQPRNDGSPARGQWDLADAYRYLSEASGGYHIDRLHGINVDAGLFMSYVGLFSYYNFDNWAYQPSYVSSNTPFFFTGVRVQLFLSDRLKIEPWIINGWQSYGVFNKMPGVGGQVMYRPTGDWSFVSNEYAGTDVLGNPDRHRIHSDSSVLWKFYDAPTEWLDKLAASFTFDAGCEFGGGATCGQGTAAAPSQFFLGFMTYVRAWFAHDHYGLTLGGGAIDNPGRYIVLLPPINGATAISGTPYFTQNPGDPFKAWDTSLTFDYMPIQFVTFRIEGTHRAANVPYFAGPGGMTPPGGNQGSPGSLVEGWAPDLVKTETRVMAALMVKL